MRIRTLTISALTVGLIVTGCGKKKDDGAGRTGGSAAAGSGSVAAGSGSGSAPAGSGAGTGSGSDAEAPLPPQVEVDKAAVQQTIDAWLAAQNGGDFAAYQALYADKMEGVKRVGARTWRFDRKGWLADRERMFKNKMTVTASDVTIAGSAQAPVVELTQGFKQGKFADSGSKRMVLVKTPAGFRIAREEMLKSVVAGALAGAAKGQVWLQMQIGDKTYVVLDTEAQDAWGTGRARSVPDSDPMLATKDASKAPSAASWMSRELAVLSNDGQRCKAKVRSLMLVSGGTPHFGTVQMWQGMDGEPPLSKAEQAREVFAMSTPKLIGELAIDGDCFPSVIVDAASTAKVFALTPIDDPAYQAKAVAAFRKLPAYASLQSDFVDNYEGQGAWVENPTVTMFSDGTRKIVVVSAREGDGCGSFYGSLSAIFEDKGGKLTLVSAPDQGYLSVTAVLDLDGDGQLELVASPDDYSTSSALYSGAGGSFMPVTSVEFPFNDCGC